VSDVRVCAAATTMTASNVVAYLPGDVLSLAPMVSMLSPGPVVPVDRGCHRSPLLEMLLDGGDPWPQLPEGAEDSLEALQHAVERLEGDAVRARRDILAAAQHALAKNTSTNAGGANRTAPTDGTATSTGAGTGGLVDPHEAAVVAALADLAPGSASGGSNPGGGNGGSGGDWSAATAEEDSLLATAAAELSNVHRDVTRKEAALRSLSRFDSAERYRDGAMAFVAAGEFTEAAAAAVSLRAAIAGLGTRGDGAGGNDDDGVGGSGDGGGNDEGIDDGAGDEVCYSARLAALRRAAEEVEAALSSRLLSELAASVVVNPGGGGGSVRVMPGALRAAWMGLPAVGAAAAAAAAASLGADLARGFFLPMAEAAAAAAAGGPGWGCTR
jgi:hypothetical protein